jgi:hypothetical protein
MNNQSPKKKSNFDRFNAQFGPIKIPTTSKTKKSKAKKMKKSFIQSS